MRKERITRNNTVKCSREQIKPVSLDKCRLCDDLFGIVNNSYILCKRGNNKDAYLKKAKKRRIKK
jgi:hypothetical protein